MVEAVLEAVRDGDGLAVACARLGQARGRAGVGIGETLDDLGVLFSVLSWPHPPLSLVRCAAEGWAETELVALAAESCEDPLTGLTTLPYLRGRLAELYRADPFGGASPAAAVGRHRLVVVDLAGGSEPWRRLARAVVVAHDLRTVFRGGETLTLVGSGRATALVPVEPGLETDVEGLRGLLARTFTAERSFLDGLHPSPEWSCLGDEAFLVWVERLPDSLPEALALLDVLAH